MILTGYTDARIPWPVGRRARVVFGDLARAVRAELKQAICHWFGVRPQTVSMWRKTLGVGLTNDGTRRLRSDYTSEPRAKRARRKGAVKNSDPNRAAKIAAADRSKPLQTLTGWVPFCVVRTVEADELVRTLPPKLAALRTL